MRLFEKTLEANIPKVYFLNFCWMFLVLIPVIIPFFQGHGLNMQEIYELQSIFAITLVICEVPSGYLGDLLGRKRTLILASFFVGMGFSILPFMDSFWGFALFEFFAGIGTALFSGTDVALLYDTYEELGHEPESSSRVMGKRVFFSQIGETVAALLGGALAMISLELPAKVNAVTFWFPLLISLTLVEPKRKKMTQGHWENFGLIYRALFQKSRLLTLTFLNCIFYGAATLLACWAYQSYWQEIGIPLVQFGVFWALSNLGVALVGRYAHDLEKQWGSSLCILLMAVFPVMGFLGMALIPYWPGVLFFLAFSASRGINAVVVRDALNRRVHTSMRATANSVAGLGIRLLFVGLGPMLGQMIDKNGVSQAFFTSGVFYIIVFFVLSVPLALEISGSRKASSV